MDERSTWITASPDGRTTKPDSPKPVKLNLSAGLSYIPKEKKISEAQFAFANKIIHAKRGLKSFDLLKIPQNAKEIDVSGNQLTDFDGLANLRDLETFNIAENKFESFLRFPHLPHLKNISVAGNPVARNQYYRTALLILCPTLHVIDGDVVRPNEHKIAKMYPPECASLLRTGWKIAYPPPKDTEVAEIKKGLMLTASPRRSPARAPTSPRPLGPPLKQSEVYERELFLQELELRAVARRVHQLQEP